MPIPILNDTLWFPPVENAQKDGLLAAGGDLSVERLLLAYRSGIFPWFSEEQIPLWWSPNPRFVLYPQELIISKSMKRILNSNVFEYKFNTVFNNVIDSCKNIYRKGQPGTWITDTVADAYKELHLLGYAHSAETWQNDVLVGGLYGVRLGNVFFGESMFCNVSNASKYAFINLINQLMQSGVVIIDCQVYTAHLESLGANMMNRKEFVEILSKNIL